ncbi:acyltransferase family protein [Mucilaginibacter sp. X4EP1]|uniref:acyltransferase family protein n=1 Tax=Mucilaginibacter sp. X4EP1 TaxID=2723092 RepID=UPI00216944EA|nr:acyltransferase [Mucilaginibacter sp. X4EP1]
MSLKKINSIQLLRAIAVSLVIFLHISFGGIEKFSQVNPIASFYHLKTWGAIGVDLFFSISGFIMTIVVPSYTQPGDWKKFFVKRFIRILPLYYLISFLTAMNIIVIHHESIPILSIAKTVLFFPFFDVKAFVDPIVGVGWSLSYEIYFYSLIGILLILKKDMYKRLLIIILLLVVAGLYFNSQNPLLKFLTSPILLEFAFGIICGLFYQKLNKISYPAFRTKTTSILLVFIGIALMGITVFVVPGFELHSMRAIENDNTLAFYRAIIWGLPSAIFMLGVILYERFFHQQISRFLVLAGDASYSCYLIHVQVYAIFAYIFKYTHLNVWIYIITVIPFCHLVSIIFYKLVEKKLVLLVDKWFHQQKPVFMD